MPFQNNCVSAQRTSKVLQPCTKFLVEKQRTTDKHYGSYTTLDNYRGKQHGISHINDSGSKIYEKIVGIFLTFITK